MGASFSLGEGPVGFRLMMPRASDPIICSGFRLDPEAWTIRFSDYAAQFALIVYVECGDATLVRGRALLPEGADLQIISACDMQSLIGETGWAIGVPGGAHSAAPRPALSSKPVGQAGKNAPASQ